MNNDELTALARAAITVAAGAAIILAIAKLLGWELVAIIAIGAVATVVRDRWVWR